MEYLNLVDDEYKRMLYSFNSKYLVKLELLNIFEKPFDSIKGEILKDVSGQITINLEQLTRRTCNVSFFNQDGKYIINEDNPFWMSKKFKLYIGISDDANTYWFEQGVYLATSVENQDGVFTVNGIDKGGAIDGSLNTNIIETQYIVEPQSNIYKVISDSMALSFNLPNGVQSNVDTVSPLIDYYYKGIYTEAEISLDSNAPIGDLIKSLADGYGADVYYDVAGRLVFEKSLPDDSTNRYSYVPIEWEFIDNEGLYNNLSLSYEYSAKNTVTVYTNSSEFENVSYTAYNDNPCSPIRVSLVGIRRMDSAEIPYVEENVKRMTQRCKEYAEYLLIQETFNGLKANFNSILMPHMDVGKAVTIVDKLNNLNDNKFIISSLSMPLDGGEMSVDATQVDFLYTE